MFRFAIVRYPLVALVTLLAVLSMSAGVSAKPTFHEQFSETIPDLDVCGVVVTLEVTLNRSVTVTDTTFRTTGTGTFVFTAADGRSVVSKFAGQNAGTITDNDDGTFTILETYNGIVDILKSGRGGVVSRSVGFITVLTTVNEETGEATSEVLVQHGQLDRDDDFIFCDAFLEALG